MTVIRQEVYNFIDVLPDNKLEALKPILALLVDDTTVIETSLTDEEKDLIRKGREEYKNNPTSFVLLGDVK